LTVNALRCRIHRLERQVLKPDGTGNALESPPETPVKGLNGASNGANGKTAAGRKRKATAGGRKRKASTPLSDPESVGSFELEDTPPPKRVKAEKHVSDDEEEAYNDDE
jgi:hypothetical protein